MADLDAQQQAAVDAGPVDVFIAAGAGSGKTRVLAARFTGAVLGDPPYAGSDPESVLTVTFTEKAAAELAERIRRVLVASGRPDAARRLGDAWISTIHGMCSRILRQNALRAGIDPQFKVLDATEASALEAQAEEDALRTAMEADPTVVALVDVYGLGAVSSALHSAIGSVRALGMGAADIATVSTGEALKRLGVVGASLGEIACALGGLRQIATVEKDAVVVRAAEAVIATLGSGAYAPDEALEALTDKGLTRCATVEGLNERVEEARELIAEGRACIAQLVVGDHERAFLFLARVFEARHQHLKRERGVLDFEDLQVETARLLEEHPAVSVELQARFAMVMIDEFQDTNALQLRIARHVARGNLCTVGDENQSIYAFRHADVEVFRSRAREVGKQHKLDINYRVAAPLLGVLNELFLHPALLGPGFMALSAPDTPGERPKWPADSPRFEACFIDCSEAKGADARIAEAECVADAVAKSVAAGTAPGDIAVLMGAMTGRAQPVERALARRGIPAVLASGGTFFECREIVEARALLKVIDNVWDDPALVAVLAGRLTGLGADALAAVRDCANEIAAEREDAYSVHLWDALVSGRVRLGDAESAAVGRMVAVVEEARRQRGLRPLGDTVLEPLLSLDMDLVCFAAGAGGSRGWANILKLVGLAAEYETSTAGDLRGFLDYLDLRELYSTNEQEATLDGEFGAVRVMSIHASKGLEFPVVVVAGLSSGPGVPSIAVARIDGIPLLGMRLPAGDEKSAEPTLGWRRVAEAERASRESEDKRLLYVACTRAQEGLTVVARTRPDREADGSIVGALRRALGVGEADAFAAREIGAGGEGGVRDAGEMGRPGDGQVRISLVAPSVAAGAAEGESPDDERPDDDAGSLRGFTLTADRVPVADAIPEADLAPSASVDTVPPIEPSSRTDVPPRPQVPPSVSYTGLAIYESCPYRYFLTRVARLVPPLAQGGDALAFGSAVHAVLEHCGSATDDLTPWLTGAAIAASLAPDSRGRLEEAVRAYLAMPVAAEVFGAARVTREAPIAVPVGGSVLVGAIDVLAWSADGGALVVDYKTGASALSAEEAAERYRLQGMSYALAAFAAGATSVRVVFAELERGRETRYEYAVDDRASLQSAIATIIGRIARCEFQPSEPLDDYVCETCPGHGTLCSFTRPAPGGAA